MIILNICILFLIFNNIVCPILHNSECHFRDMYTKPESDKIAQFENVAIHASCLLKCDENDGCESIVYDANSGSCTLFNTSTGGLPLSGQEKATTRTGGCVKTYDGPIPRINPPQPVSVSAITCTSSTEYNSDFSCSNTLDESHAIIWLPRADSPPDWIMYTFDETRRITQIDMWRSKHAFYRCKKIKVTVGSVINEHEPPCFTVGPTLYTIFQKNSGLQITQFRIECLVKCSTTFGFDYITVYEKPPFW